MLKKMSKKTIASVILLSLILILALSFMLRASANREVTLTTYYPAPYGNYKDIYATDLTVNGVLSASAPATPGTGKGRIYFNSSENKFKVSEGGAYANLGGGGPWTEASPNIYNTNLDYNVGIGTATPNSRFQVKDLINFDSSTRNVFVGFQAGYSNTSGTNSVANGYQALYSNTSGHSNTANGFYAMQYNQTGTYNVAIGDEALRFNTTGDRNTAIGDEALYSNTTGDRNTANGGSALSSNTTGFYNTANGYQALWKNTTGSYNAANGMQALCYNTSGSYNTANGWRALFTNTTASYNVANGAYALFFNTEGASNTANGEEALKSNTTGNDNTAVGFAALYNNTTTSGNVALGAYAGFNAIGSNNVFIGYNAGRNETGSNKLYIANTSGTPLIYGDFSSGNVGIGTSTPQYRLDVNGASSPSYLNLESTASGDTVNGGAGIRLKSKGNWGGDIEWHIYNSHEGRLAIAAFPYYGQGQGDAGMINLYYRSMYPPNRSYIVLNGETVLNKGGSSGPYTLTVNGDVRVNGSGTYTGTWLSSDIRFKKNISAINKAMDKVLKLRGVIFEWKTKEYKKKGFPEGKHYGVIAQEIEKVLPEVVTTDKEGEKAVAYSEIIPVLIEAIKDQQKQITELKEQQKTQQKQITELKAQNKLLEQRLVALEKAIKVKKNNTL